jgi:hypothetical protein
MAIKNVIKAGTYSRIRTIIYESGLVQKVEIECYETAPTKTFKELRSVETVTVDGEEVEQFVQETVEIIHIFSFYNEDLLELEIDASKNMHGQIYTHLMTKSLFAGCISDE